MPSMLASIRRVGKTQIGQLEALLVKQQNLTSRSVSSLQCSTSYSTCASTLQTAQRADDRQNFGSWLIAATAAATIAAASKTTKADEVAEIHPEEKSWQILPLSTRQRTFFKYEKRIRDLSGPDKIFEYFATEEKADGTRLMKPENLLSSLVAIYPPEGSGIERAGFLPGERAPQTAEGTQMNSKFFQMFDVDGDGLISYSEYLLLITFLSIPVEDVKLIFEMFDCNDDGTMDQAEFDTITSNLRKQSKNAEVTRTGFRSPPEKGNRGLYLYFFGEDGKTRMPLDKFDEFLKSLHDEIVRLEFSHYDYQGKGKMSGKDFARSVVCSVHTNQIEDYLSKVDALPEKLATAEVKFEDFKEFASLRKELHKLQVALEFYQKTTGHFGLEDLKRAVRKVMNRDLSDVPLHIVFALFDENKDNNLAAAELLTVLRERQHNHLQDLFSIESSSKSKGLLARFGLVLPSY